MLAQFTYPFPPREHILWQFLDTFLSAISLFQDSGPHSSCQNAMETWNSVFENRVYRDEEGIKIGWKNSLQLVHPVFSSNR